MNERRWEREETEKHWKPSQRGRILLQTLSCTSFGFWDPLAEREIIKICPAKSTRLGLSDSNVVSSLFRLLSCALMRGLASMILNRDLYCDDIDDDQSLND